MTFLLRLLGEVRVGVKWRRWVGGSVASGAGDDVVW